MGLRSFLLFLENDSHFYEYGHMCFVVEFSVERTNEPKML